MDDWKIDVASGITVHFQPHEGYNLRFLEAQLGGQSQEMDDDAPIYLEAFVGSRSFVIGRLNADWRQEMEMLLVFDKPVSVSHTHTRSVSFTAMACDDKLVEMFNRSDVIKCSYVCTSCTSGVPTSDSICKFCNPEDVPGN